MYSTNVKRTWTSVFRFTYFLNILTFMLTWVMLTYFLKFYPLRFTEIFFLTAENFLAKFYALIVCLSLRQIAKLYSIIFKCDRVMPY